jgi:hypothetical protein
MCVGRREGISEATERNLVFLRVDCALQNLLNTKSCTGNKTDVIPTEQRNGSNCTRRYILVKWGRKATRNGNKGKISRHSLSGCTVNVCLAGLYNGNVESTKAEMVHEWRYIRDRRVKRREKWCVRIGPGWTFGVQTPTGRSTLKQIRQCCDFCGRGRGYIWVSLKVELYCIII